MQTTQTPSQLTSSFRWRPSRVSTISHAPLAGTITPQVQRSKTIQIASAYRSPDYVEQAVSAYNLEWAKLRKWLVEERFANEPELAKSLVEDLGYADDFFRFYIPNSLTPSDGTAINRLRDVTSKAKARTSRSVSPDPDPDSDEGASPDIAESNRGKALSLTEYSCAAITSKPPAPRGDQAVQRG
ncbi:hypothetical protein PG985_014128 [Apiospora marii]|uniref:Uncharacterized protein n=1 Tax=Apiospora marii TaxID=335849 RepID=A0ABR1R6J6_9PEZI